MADELDAHLREFMATPWGELGAQQGTSKDMCKRVSLALLADLRRRGVDGRLWCMTRLLDSAWGGPADGQHYVVEVEGEALDLTCRQFGAENPYPLREPIATSQARWECAEGRDPDNGWTQRFTDYISPRWSELPDVEPPGDELGWPTPPGGR